MQFRNSNGLRSTVALLVAAMSFSCTTPLYVPSAIHTPSLEQAGEVEVSGRFGTNGYDGMLGVAITDEIGVMVNGSYARESSSDDVRFREHQYMAM